jgi:hypothetical protein
MAVTEPMATIGKYPPPTTQNKMARPIAAKLRWFLPPARDARLESSAGAVHRRLR